MSSRLTRSFTSLDTERVSSRMNFPIVARRVANVSLFLLSGYHNYAQTFYGTPAWNCKWSLLNGDGNMTWGCVSSFVSLSSFRPTSNAYFRFAFFLCFADPTLPSPRTGSLKLKLSTLLGRSKPRPMLLSLRSSTRLPCDEPRPLWRSLGEFSSVLSFGKTAVSDRFSLVP